MHPEDIPKEWSDPPLIESSGRNMVLYKIELRMVDWLGKYWFTRDLQLEVLDFRKGESRSGTRTERHLLGGLGYKQLQLRWRWLVGWETKSCERDGDGWSAGIQTTATATAMNGGL